MQLEHAELYLWDTVISALASFMLGVLVASVSYRVLAANSVVGEWWYAKSGKSRG
ncbi:hypothetical protein IC235_00665 [Hymenobacter sp. BT664]|uniref:Uncharacterized protein n=1 Tax=Hymenobacter montanus TaxID=2771359 RepID=A0A927BA44_9BACT|nr:hypothetical protein [Hymenobacter montanus]MBD2766399.1 hypothetical protein [Hymenobacter montanus]